MLTSGYAMRHEGSIVRATLRALFAPRRLMPIVLLCVLTDFTLQELADKLPAASFLRVHRRALLSLAHVTRLEPLETGGFLARTQRGHTVEVSRQSARELRRLLGLRRGGADEG
jgi:hypothetical protein